MDRIIMARPSKKLDLCSAMSLFCPALYQDLAVGFRCIYVFTVFIYVFYIFYFTYFITYLLYLLVFTLTESLLFASWTVTYDVTCVMNTCHWSVTSCAQPRVTRVRWCMTSPAALGVCASCPPPHGRQKSSGTGVRTWFLWRGHRGDMGRGAWTPILAGTFCKILINGGGVAGECANN